MFDPMPDIEPNPGQIFRSIYSIVLEPFDLANTQLLIQRYEDDLQRDDGWLYLGFQRRVRRLAVGQITDAFLGTDAMIEDFEGYNGRISDYKWTYRGTQNILMPYEKHNEQPVLDTEPAGDKDGFRFVKFGGQGNCFPQVTWQLRKSYVIEGNPKDPNHPLSKRMIYMDTESATLPHRASCTTRRARPGSTSPSARPTPTTTWRRTRGSVLPSTTARCSSTSRPCTARRCSSSRYINPQENPPSIFNVQNMRKTGR